MPSEEGTMTTTVQNTRSVSTRRMALALVGVFVVVLLAGTFVLWAKLGTAVFYELIVAGIRYCF
jgi:hypothetical protein